MTVIINEVILVHEGTTVAVVAAHTEVGPVAVVLELPSNSRTAAEPEQTGRFARRPRDREKNSSRYRSQRVGRPSQDFDRATIPAPGCAAARTASVVVLGSWSVWGEES